MPEGAKEDHAFIDIPEINKNIIIKYFNASFAFFQDERRFEEYKYNIGMPALQNVVIGAIYSDYGRI